MPIDLDKFTDGLPNEETDNVSPADDEKYDDLAEFYENPRPKKSGGGKKTRQGDKTRDAIAEKNREDAQEKRRQDNLLKIRTQLNHFPTSLNPERQRELHGAYCVWVTKNLDSKDLELNFDPDAGEIEYKNYRKSSGPGGQNVNKTAQTARYTHKVTGIYGESTEERDLLRNQALAKAKLQIRLEQHLQYWKEVLKGSNAEDRNEYILKYLDELL